MGMPSKFKQEYVYQVEQVCMAGFIAPQVADLFGVETGTIYNWRKVYPDFKEAMDAGRDVYNQATAETCLQKRLEGYFYNETTSELVGLGAAAKMKVVKIVKKHVPADSQSLRFFLRNRDKERWPDNQEVNVNLIRNLSDKELDKQIHLIVDNTKKRKKRATG
jgi:hypothetical protein